MNKNTYANCPKDLVWFLKVLTLSNIPNRATVTICYVGDIPEMKRQVNLMDDALGVKRTFGDLIAGN